MLADVAVYSRVVLPRWRLRGYQEDPARVIAASVAAGRGGQFAVVFSRQAGKDELLAQLLAWLLTRYQRRGGSAVLAAPTFRPQAALSRDRPGARASNPRARDGDRRPLAAHPRHPASGTRRPPANDATERSTERWR